MKHSLIGFVVGVAVTVAVFLCGQNLLSGMEKSKCKRFAANLRSVKTAVERYRVDHGAYPAVSTIAELANLLEPDYWRRVPEQGMSYDSDGMTYRVSSHWHAGDGPTCGCYFEMRDGVFVKWPDYLGPDFD